MISSLLFVLCTLYIGSFSGDILIKTQGTNSWKTPTTQQMVTRVDSVRIPKGAHLCLVDDAVGTVYDCSSPTKSNINQCLIKAQKDANNVLLGLAAQIKSNAMGTSKSMPNRPIYGGTTRAEDENAQMDSIACLAMALSSGKESLPEGLALSIEKDGPYNVFVMDNRSNEYYYVNVLAVKKDAEEISLCIVPSPDIEPEALLLPPEQTLKLSMFRFIPSADKRYILFATKTQFVPSALQTILRYPEDLTCP